MEVSAEELAISSQISMYSEGATFPKGQSHDLRVYLSLADGVSVFLLSPLVLL